uniref:B-cell translocation gene 3 n=1 Tax=Sinocyclocheilus grahami TaxID=75366 RepID=A0A672KFE8_SINGR
ALSKGGLVIFCLMHLLWPQERSQKLFFTLTEVMHFKFEYNSKFELNICILCRCIRVNRFHKEDAELLRACAESGVQYKDLGLPKELTLWVDPGEVCCRYGERNHGFTVATFSSDDDADDKEDVTKKVTSAVERVTSDYHSGSSSDEDTRLATFKCNQIILWHPVPRKKFGLGKGHYPQRPHYIIRPPCRPNHSFKPHSWVQQGYRSKHGYWGSTSNLVHQLQ